LRLYLIEERNIKLDLIVLSYTSNLLFAYLVSVYGLVGVLIGGNSIMSNKDKTVEHEEPICEHCGRQLLCPDCHLYVLCIEIRQETARKIFGELEKHIRDNYFPPKDVEVLLKDLHQYWEGYGIL
jgi:hypothetical protein